ncbi:MAG: (2Fe-2S)-binding protein [Bdellovibrionales bacterium]|nr:(2Fe-2S)-binding protein [Bdellovibrionales bacterium]
MPDEPPQQPEPDRTVCFCHNVPRSRIIAEIRAGNRTLQAIRACTHASTGCGGCEFEVREILAEEAKLADEPDQC